MMGEVALGIDAGLTATKAALFTPEGEEVAVGSRETPTERPASDHREVQLSDLWEVTTAACSRRSTWTSFPDVLPGVILWETCGQRSLGHEHAVDRMVSVARHHEPDPNAAALYSDRRKTFESGLSAIRPTWKRLMYHRDRRQTND